ncbi:MAG: N(2)-acetyl-L-2,4-diaminobutanoate deacetylase DoeB2 [Woeseia sp.]
MPEIDAIPWGALIQRAVGLRHDLHRQPELGWQERATAERIRARLDELSITWRQCADTGTVARLAANAPGRHIALRADIDALAIHEATGTDWASESTGLMHACGHDGHTATLMAAAEWLKHCEADLPGPVTLLFQPAEEGGHGAKRMIEDGALDGVDAVFGWHNWPAIPFGQAVCPDGVVMAGNGTFRIDVTGQGGHASQPEACRDPVLAASAIVVALQQVVSRCLPAQDATVLSVTSFDAKSGPTTIPDTATLEGSFRLADTSRQPALVEHVQRIAQATAQSYGAHAAVTVFPRYQATVNHPPEAARFRQALAAEFGPGVVSLDTALPIMASEDFSYYLRERPGAFALIGANDGPGRDTPCHSPRYDFNDALISPVARIYARLAGAQLPGERENASNATMQATGS